MHTLPIIAQSMPEKEWSYQGLVAVVLGISVLCNLVQIWAMTLGRNRAQKIEPPQPLEVRAAADYASRHSVDELGKKVDANHKDALDRIAALDETRRVSVSKVYEAMRAEAKAARDEQAAEIRELRSEVREDMRGIHERLTDIAASVGAATGELKRVQKGSINA